MSGIIVVRNRLKGLKVLTGLNFFRTVRIVKTIRTITRSGIIVVRDRLNCLKGLTGLNDLNYQSKKNRSLPKGTLRKIKHTA